jgi:ligand-binding SRPBCC domain-containing protein
MRWYSHRFQVYAPLESLAEFHNESLAFKRLTPPPLFVSFNKVDWLSEG